MFYFKRVTIGVAARAQFKTNCVDTENRRIAHLPTDVLRIHFMVIRYGVHLKLYCCFDRWKTKKSSLFD